MLFIGDIHINSKIQDRLFSKLKSRVLSQESEKNLIFLGDFVYHFSYDRKALLALFDWFVELYQQGKSLYILAGNHDWLGQHFVFSEGQKILESFKSAIHTQGDNVFRFITSPEFHEIEGEKFLFLPYMLEIDQIGDIQTGVINQQGNNKNEQFSMYLNQFLKEAVQKYHKFTLVHHYYIADTVFPGQKSKFMYRDRSLDSALLDNPDISLISGHLHKAFIYKNYLCTGSTWSTSPLEENQIKGAWKLTNHQREFYELGVNYYISMDANTDVNIPLTGEDIQSFYSVLTKNFQDNCSGIVSHFLGSLDLQNVSLSLRVPQLDYTQLDAFVAPELQKSLLDLKLRKNQIKIDDLLSQIVRPEDSLLREGFGGWTNLLRDLLKKKYPDNYPAYEAMLYDMKLL